jgi:hypothetical protein
VPSTSWLSLPQRIVEVLYLLVAVNVVLGIAALVLLWRRLR